MFGEHRRLACQQTRFCGHSRMCFHLNLNDRLECLHCTQDRQASGWNHECPTSIFYSNVQHFLDTDAPLSPLLPTSLSSVGKFCREEVKDEIIPYAIQYFLGEISSDEEDDDYDGEYDDEDDDEDDDDDDDDVRVFPWILACPLQRSHS